MCHFCDVPVFSIVQYWVNGFWKKFFRVNFLCFVFFQHHWFKSRCVSNRIKFDPLGGVLNVDQNYFWLLTDCSWMFTFYYFNIKWALKWIELKWNVMNWIHYRFLSVIGFRLLKYVAIGPEWLGFSVQPKAPETTGGVIFHCILVDI